jgi:PKD repeat protein
MNLLQSYLLYFVLASVGAVSLLGCGKWELPDQKSQRACTQPSGTLSIQAQQRKINCAITNSSGTIDRVEWDFGNTSTTITTGLTVSYTYPTPGTYTVKAKLTNTCKVETTLQQTISVTDAIAPTVTLEPASDLTLNTATLRMSITGTGNATITSYGICYSSTNPQPEVGKDQVGSTTVSIAPNTPVSFSLTGLTENTRYYVRAFAINNVATQPGYSSPTQTFTTGQSPAVVTGTASPGVSSATVNFLIDKPGSPAAIEYGICYSSTNSIPDLINSATAKVGSPSIGTTIPVNLPGLTTNKTYYYRAYARLATGEVKYGDVMTFTTQVDTLSTDLIASVSFTDQSLQDVSGNNNNVRLAGNPTFTTDRAGKVNSAILLNGSTDYFYIPDNATLNPSALSVSIWIKPTSVSRRMQIYNKSRFSDGTAELFSSLIKPNPDDAAGIVINTDIKQNSNCQPGVGWQTFTFPGRPDLSKWHHVVMTYTGNSARMYFDNALLYTVDNLPRNTLDVCPGGDLKFGVQSRDLPNYFLGALDDIRIYKRALTASEIQTLFNQ